MTGHTKTLNPIFRIDGAMPAAIAADIEALKESASVPLPLDYLDVVTVMTDVELLVNGRKYLRIWGPLRCIEMNEVYEIQKHIPLSLAIGDDEGGDAFILMDGRAGHGLYKVGLSVLDPDDATFIAPSLGELLVNGTGWESV